MLNKKQQACVGPRVTEGTVKILGWLLSSLSGFSCSDMVMECGQTEARETIELLKELPTDVYHELLQGLLQSLLQ